MEMKHNTFLSTFKPLKDRNFSVYAGGQVLSLTGSAMQNTALSWVVWQLTKSTTALGLVIILGALPMLLFGAFTGKLLDSINRRKLLITTQILAMCTAFIFAVLLQTSYISPGLIYLLAFVLGCVIAVDTPAQSAFVGDISGRENMQEAVVINNMLVQLSRTIGPAVAGIMLGVVNTAAVFWINGASFLVVIGTLISIRTRKDKEVHDDDSGSMGEAFAFIGKNPRAIDLIIISVILTFFAFSSGTLLPSIVTDTLHKGSQTLGLLEGATGAGPLIGSFIIVPIARRIKRCGLLLSSTLVYLGALMFVLAFSTHYFVAEWFWAACMFLSTLAVPVILTISNSILQLIAPEKMRGRIVGIMFMFAFGVMPFGSLLIGFLGSAAGSLAAYEIYSIALVLGGIIMLTARKGLTAWQPMKGAEFFGN